MKIINVSDAATLPRLCKWHFPCQLCSVQLVYSADAMCWFEAFWEEKKECVLWFTHAAWEIISHIKFLNYFVSYLMKKYELYLTFSIIIILPAPDRLRQSHCISYQTSPSRSIFSLRSAFIENADQTSERLWADSDR